MTSDFSKSSLSRISTLLLSCRITSFWVFWISSQLFLIPWWRIFAILIDSQVKPQMKARCSTCGMVHTTHNNKHRRCVTLCIAPGLTKLVKICRSRAVFANNSSIFVVLAQLAEAHCTSQQRVQCHPATTVQTTRMNAKWQLTLFRHNVGATASFCPFCLDWCWLLSMMASSVDSGVKKTPPTARDLWGIWMCIRTHFLSGCIKSYWVRSDLRHGKCRVLKLNRADGFIGPVSLIRVSFTS